MIVAQRAERSGRTHLVSGLTDEVLLDLLHLALVLLVGAAVRVGAVAGPARHVRVHKGVRLGNQAAGEAGKEATGRRRTLSGRRCCGFHCLLAPLLSGQVGLLPLL